jgi:sugar lactone lactonase YvrE
MRFLIAISLAAAQAALAADGRSTFKPTAQDQIVPADSKLELLWNEGDFTEGPAPDKDGAILFSDIGNRILRFDPASGSVTVFRDPSGRSNGLKFNPAGLLVACEGANTGGNRRISITEPSGRVRILADRFEGKRFNSPNDLAIAADGRIYFTDPRYLGEEPRELDFEAVFLIEPDGKVRVATRDVEKPNGIIVTPDGRTAYVSDNNSRRDGKHQLVAFAAQPDGTLVQKRVLHDFGPDSRGIDGMTLDMAGNIYATAGTGPLAGVYVFGSQGQPLAFISMPGDPTNCVFGVGLEATTLYVTAAGPGALRPNGKRAYGLYRIRLAHPGYHVFPQPKS